MGGEGKRRVNPARQTAEKERKAATGPGRGRVDEAAGLKPHSPQSLENSSSRAPGVQSPGPRLPDAQLRFP